MHWYNPKQAGGVEDVPAPLSDQEALEMLSGDPGSEEFIAEYKRLRNEGMPIEQAMIFVGHHFRLWHLRLQPIG